MTTLTLCHPGVTANFLGMGVFPIKEPSMNTFAPSRLQLNLRNVFRLVKSGGRSFTSSILANFLVSRLTLVLTGGWFNNSFAVLRSFLLSLKTFFSITGVLVSIDVTIGFFLKSYLKVCVNLLLMKV